MNLKISLTMEAVANCTKYVISVVTLILFCHVTHFANAQPGFLSIDCGGKENRTDTNTNISWVTDSVYIDLGYIADLEYNVSTWTFYLQSQRVFPKPLNKSCYQLPLTPNVPHLLRLSFLANNLSGSGSFNYSVEASDMLYLKTVSIGDQLYQGDGKILVSSGKAAYICFIRTSEFYDPFISAIELRTLKPGMYSMAKPGALLQNIVRYDVGGENLTRYPQDPFDRMWAPITIAGAQNLRSEDRISVNNTQNFPPTNVMQTAAQAIRPDRQYPEMQISTTNTSVVIMYFAELNASETRSFNVGINNGSSNTTRRINSGAFLSATEELFVYNTSGYISLRLYPGFIINAFEYYLLVPTQPLTSSKEVEVLHDVKPIFNMKSWISDPCFAFPWEGIKCVISFNNTVRILEINLSGRNLRGSIPPNFGRLTELVYISLENNYFNGTFPNLSSLSKLERLHLQNNNLSGSIPEWLSKLHNLRELFIGNNNFSGVIPQQLLDRKPLVLQYSGNKYLCVDENACLPSSTSTSSPSKQSSTSTSSPSKRQILGIAFGVVGGGIVTAILVGIMVYRKKFKSSLSRHNRNSLKVLVPNSSKSRAFTLYEMTTATENFSHTIGHGGFGSVFLGNLQDGKKIAVKVLSCFTKQGIAQFLNEVDLLSRINHKKLVSLLGYCNESKDLMLVYEYMSGGSLSDNLYSPQPSEYPQLDWKARLKIALDAAQGLEYLHVGCNPKIIHRDVKTANILLDNDLNGKLADFGISRMTIAGETSQINTTIKGTPGYLDPKYYQTHILTDKSDVYSFGVVLLELICGRKPIDKKLSTDKILMTEWVAAYVGVDKDPTEVEKIVDKRLGMHYNRKDMCNVANLAWRCLAGEPSCRPTLSEVVVEIKEAMTYEDEDYEVSDE